MAGRYYFLLSALPPLPPLGEAPPLELARFRALAAEEGSATDLIDALLLDYDLLLREAAGAGEVAEVEPVVLTADQARGEAPLELAPPAAPSVPQRIPADAVWAAYYRHVARLAEARRCAFARRWVGFEVALRNAIAAARAEALDLDPQGYLVAPDLADIDAAVGALVSAWSAAPDPLAGLRRLDEGRWRWTEENSRHFSFALDELAAYTRRLILVTRWHALRREAAPDPAKQGA